MVKRKNQPFIYLFILLVLSALFFLLLRKEASEQARQPIITDHFNDQWAMQDLWIDGKAEVALYKAERIVYGKVRHFEYAYILVKETFNREFNVKTDDYDRDDLFDVMKVNKFARIETDNYPYHYLTSLFFLRDDPVSLYKLTNGSQEWCGNTFKHIDDENINYVYYYDSYFDQEGRGTMSLPGEILFEDQLSYSLRTLNFSEDMKFSYPIVATLVTNRVKKPVIYKGTISVNQASDTIHADQPYTPDLLWKVAVQLEENKKNSYWFTKEYPNYLVKMKAWDGRKLLLESLKREAYWMSE